MKQIWYAVCLLTGSLLYSIHASAQTTASGALLAQMSQASQTLDYEYACVLVSKLGVDSRRYRHVVIDKQRLAQLLQMDGLRREIVQRNGEISYFDLGLEPFTLLGDHIVDSLPSIVYANFERLAHFYDFISVGAAPASPITCARLCGSSPVTAPDLATSSGLIPRPNCRCASICWIAMAKRWNSSALSRLTPVDRSKTRWPVWKRSPCRPNWRCRCPRPWISTGALTGCRRARPKPHAAGVRCRASMNRRPGCTPMDCSASSSMSARRPPAMVRRLIRTGRRTIHTEQYGSREITVVGELPPATAKRIADAVVFKAQP